MAKCDNCESFITEDYRRMYEVDGDVKCCPHCPDKVRVNGQCRLDKNHK